MKYSLLYLRPEPERYPGAASDLLLPDTLEKICGPGSGYFVRVISSPLSSEENILFRREILADLENGPALLVKLKRSFGRYDRLREDWIETRSGVSAVRPTRANAEASLASSWAALKAVALFPDTLLSFLKEIAEVLCGAELCSRGLINVRDRCAELCGDGVLTEIAGIAGKFRGTSPEKNGLELEISAWPDLCSAGAKITDVFELSDKKRGRGLLKKKKAGSSDGESEADCVLLSAAALYHLESVISGVTDRLYGSLYGLSRELDFYACAMRYTAFLREKGSLVYPEISGSGAKITDLYDLRLLTERQDVTPCDLRISDGKAGLLIRGENGAGKTTFLRSVGTAYLMFQAGLPVPAKTAAMRPVNGIYTHFSSAEDDFLPGDRSGRFEGEVRAVSEMLSRAERGGLILMNETFQSTEFGEGTRAMRGILSVLPEAGIRYILVTHLTGLFDAPELCADRLEFNIRKHNYTILEETK